jgi:hypothetical protein
MSEENVVSNPQVVQLNENFIALYSSIITFFPQSGILQNLTTVEKLYAFKFTQ